MLTRKRVGLALSGGVTRGPAHIGVLKVLLENGIPIDAVAGVSAGSVIGAAYCAGIPLADMIALANRMSWWRVARPVWPRRGFVSFKRLQQLVAELIEDRDFQELTTPFVVVATDLHHGVPVSLWAGRVASAVHASCAVPGFVEPVERDGLLLGDGGVSLNLPGPAVRALGVDYVIGVDLMQPHLRRRFGAFRFGALALETLIEHSGGGLGSVDCLIRPDLAGFNSLHFSQREYLIERGVHAAQARLEKIRADLAKGEPAG
jgi:NTE family protein